MLYTLADSDELFDLKYPLAIDIDSSSRFPIELRPSAIRLIFPSDQKTYLGGFWESRVVPPILKEIRDQRYEFGYTGIDRFVYDALRDRQFRRLCFGASGVSADVRAFTSAGFALSVEEIRIPSPRGA